MAREALTHNPLNGVTADVWRDGEVVVKVLTRRAGAPAHWAASDDPRHWNYWRREADVYESGLPERIGLGAPRLLGSIDRDDGDVELRLEHVSGRHSAELALEDLEAAAGALGRAQARPGPDEPWLSRGFLRAYSSSRAVAWELLYDDDAWAQPLVREHFGPGLRDALVRLHERREALWRLMERLPRALCHLDVWPNNLIRRPDGEDVGNLVPDSVLDLLLPHERLEELDERLTRAYLSGLREAGWAGDERLVRLGICASAVKYDWLTVFCLEHASAAEQPAYGHGGTVDAAERYAARAAGLALLARWADEALELRR